MKRNDPTRPAGTWEVRRRIALPGFAHAADAPAIAGALKALEGVRAVVPEPARRRVVVRYDASETDYGAVVERLAAQGYPPADGRWSRLKGRWFQFLDTNARANARAPAPPCCNRPPK